MPTGPATGSPKFQPKYIPAITTPTPSAQMWTTRRGFLRTCSRMYSISSGRISEGSMCASLMTS